MNELLVRVPREQQDLTAQRKRLRALSIGDDRIGVRRRMFWDSPPLAVRTDGVQYGHERRRPWPHDPSRGMRGNSFLERISARGLRRLTPAGGSRPNQQYWGPASWS